MTQQLSREQLVSRVRDKLIDGSITQDQAVQVLEAWKAQQQTHQQTPEQPAQDSAAQQPQDERGMFRRGYDWLNRGAAQVNRSMLGVGESALQMGSQAIAEPLAGVAGIAGTILPGEEGQGARWIEGTREALTYNPVSQAGQQASQELGQTLAPVGEAIGAAEQFAGDVGYSIGGATGGAIGASIPTALAELVHMPNAAKNSRKTALADAIAEQPEAMSQWKEQARSAGMSEQDIADIERRVDGEPASAITDSLRDQLNAPNDPIESLSDGLKKGDSEQVIQGVMADPRVIESAERLGIDITPGVASQSVVYREVETSLKTLPGSRLSEQQKNTISQLDQQANDLISDFGGVRDKSALSYDFKDRSLDKVKRMEDVANQLYAQINESVPPDIKVKPLSTVEYLKSEAERLGSIDDLDPKLRKVYKRFTSGQGVNHALIDQVRKDVGSGLKGAGVFKDASQNHLKMLYGALVDDSLRAPEFLGLRRESKAARNIVRKRKLLEENLISALGKDLSKSLTEEVGAGVRQMQKGSAEKFKKIMSSLPNGDRRTVAVTALNDVLASGSRSSKDFSLTGFVNAYEGLKKNQRASNELFKYLPNEAKSRLDDIYRVSKGLVKLNERDLFNPSGSGKAIIGGLNHPDGPLKKLYRIGKQGAAGGAITSPFDAGAIGATAGVINAIKSERKPATQAADEMLASPDFQRALAVYMKEGKKPTGSSRANRILMGMDATRRWYRNQPAEVRNMINQQGLIQYLFSIEGEDDGINPQR